jgi:hypothetical protein
MEDSISLVVMTKQTCPQEVAIMTGHQLIMLNQSILKKDFGVFDVVS